jgi:hypothetical protein
MSDDSIHVSVSKRTTGSSSEVGLNADLRPLSVGIIYTSLYATICALKAAEILAQDIAPMIQLHVAVSVPQRISLSQPPISVSFLRRQLSDMVLTFGSTGYQYVLHIYLCRNRLDALLSVLRPNSVLVVGGYSHFWPTRGEPACDGVERCWPQRSFHRS